MKFASKFLLAKIQDDPDTDPSPDGSNAIQTADLTFDGYSGETAEFNVDRLTLGASKTITTIPMNTLSFNVQFASAGGESVAPEDEPGWGVLMRACGLSETVDNTVDEEKVIYAPVSTDFEEIALYFMRIIGDGVDYRHPTLNVKGNMSISAEAAQIPQFQFDNMMGLYVRPTRQTTQVEPVTTVFRDALPLTSGNTPTFTVDGHEFCINSFTFNLNNTVSFGDEPNCKGSSIEDRDPGGQIVLKATDPDTKDVYAMIESHLGDNTFAVALQHGNNDNEILEVNIPICHPTGISETNVRGELYYQIDFSALPSDDGDDEFELIKR